MYWNNHSFLLNFKLTFQYFIIFEKVSTDYNFLFCNLGNGMQKEWSSQSEKLKIEWDIKINLINIFWWKSSDESNFILNILNKQWHVWSVNDLHQATHARYDHWHWEHMHYVHCSSPQNMNFLIQNSRSTLPSHEVFPIKNFKTF